MTGSTKRKVRYLDASEIDQAVDELALIAKEERVRVALLGGVAMQLYGSTRLTKDVDIAASDRLESLAKGKRLSFGGEKTRTPGGIPVDVVRRSDAWRRLYNAALSTASRIKDVPIPVVRYDYLAATKMAAGRPNDQADLAFLVLADPKGVPAIRDVVVEFLGLYAGNELDAFVAEMTWRRKTGRL